mgnify:CR=1 FL=1
MEYAAPPSVRRLAAEHGVDLGALAARTGRSLITRDDVEAARKPPPDDPHDLPWRADPADHGPVERVALSPLERAALRQMAAANARIPQVTHHDEADLRAVEALRADLAAEAAARGVRLTALTLHVAALARCLREFPRVNASLDADGTALWLKRHVHIGVAMDTPRGLVVPVLRDVAGMGLWRIAEALAELAARARAGRLGPAEMGGASMTVSNLGSIGGTGFTPIVNPPEVAILGIARSRIAPVWDGAAFRPVPVAPVSLSHDHRVIDGATAARFLARHCALIADPRRLLL